MFVDVHAIVILTTLIVPVMLIAWNHSWRPRSLPKAMVPALAITSVGMACLLLLSVFGVPIAEWVFPGVGAAFGGFFVKSQRLFRTMGWALFLATVGLCLNFCFLTRSGYTSSPGRTAAMYASLERAFVKSLSDQMGKAFPANDVLPQTPLNEILPGRDHADWDRKTMCRLWHTWFTGLYEITTIPGEIWYPGGPVASATGSLRWKAKKK